MNQTFGSQHFALLLVHRLSAGEVETELTFGIQTIVTFPISEVPLLPAATSRLVASPVRVTVAGAAMVVVVCIFLPRQFQVLTFGSATKLEILKLYCAKIQIYTLTKIVEFVLLGLDAKIRNNGFPMDD